jgi:indolepyruvate ferredoxin oxidoreductase alpha subunit
LPADPLQFVLLPAVARKRYHNLLGVYEDLKSESRISRYNSYKDCINRETGVIACGIAYNYLLENIGYRNDIPVLKISAYPFSPDLIKDIVYRCKSVLYLKKALQ